MPPEDRHQDRRGNDRPDDRDGPSVPGAEAARAAPSAGEAGHHLGFAVFRAVRHQRHAPKDGEGAAAPRVWRVSAQGIAAGQDDQGGMMTIRDRIRTRRPTTDASGETRRTGATHADHPPAAAETRYRPAASARERQRDEFGGINWGSAFFGWIVAIGIGALLTALLSAAGAAVAISNLNGVGDAGGIALFVIALLAYYAGGYVAGRMSRFDGARQGLAVWLWGLIVAIILAVVGAIAGNEYNVFGSLNLPRIPIDEGTVTTGGVIVLVAVVVGTVLAAMAGGKAGERYHRRVD